MYKTKYIFKKIIKKSIDKILLLKKLIANMRKYYNIDKELLYFVIISSMYESIGFQFLYVISIDKITRVFSSIHKELSKWKKLVLLGMNPLDALLYNALSSSSKKWRDFIINYITLQRIGGSAVEFFNRKVEDSLNEIKQMWKRYQENIVFVIEVFLITIFSTIIIMIMTVSLNTSMNNMLFITALFIITITAFSILIIDRMAPTEIGYYSPKRYSIILSLLMLIIGYQLIDTGFLYHNNVVLRMVTLTTITLIPLSIDNFIHYMINVKKDNDSILTVLDHIIASQRSGIQLTKLKSTVNNANSITQRIKKLFNKSLDDEELSSFNYKERILSSLIIGLKYVGLIPYEILLKLRNILGEITGIENSTRKSLNILTLLTILLPSIIMIVLFQLVNTILGIYKPAPIRGNFYASMYLNNNTNVDIYVNIYLYSILLAVSLNMITSKAIDLSLRSYWRIHISLLLIVISHYLLTSFM